MCNVLLFLENVACLIAIVLEWWLHHQAYTITGPLGRARIYHVWDIVFVCVFTAVGLGLLSLVALRLLRQSSPEMVKFRKRWTYVSLVASVTVFLFAFYPILVG